MGGSKAKQNETDLAVLDRLVSLGSDFVHLWCKHNDDSSSFSKYFLSDSYSKYNQQVKNKAQQTWELLYRGVAECSNCRVTYLQFKEQRPQDGAVLLQGEVEVCTKVVSDIVLITEDQLLNSESSMAMASNTLLHLLDCELMQHPQAFSLCEQLVVRLDSVFELEIQPEESPGVVFLLLSMDSQVIELAQKFAVQECNWAEQNCLDALQQFIEAALHAINLQGFESAAKSERAWLSLIFLVSNVKGLPVVRLDISEIINAILSGIADNQAGRSDRSSRLPLKLLHNLLKHYSLDLIGLLSQQAEYMVSTLSEACDDRSVSYDCIAIIAVLRDQFSHSDMKDVWQQCFQFLVYEVAFTADTAYQLERDFAQESSNQVILNTLSTPPNPTDFRYTECMEALCCMLMRDAFIISLKCREFEAKLASVQTEFSVNKAEFDCQSLIALLSEDLKWSEELLADVDVGGGSSNYQAMRHSVFSQATPGGLQDSQRLVREWALGPLNDCKWEVWQQVLSSLTADHLPDMSAWGMLHHLDDNSCITPLLLSLSQLSLVSTVAYQSTNNASGAQGVRLEENQAWLHLWYWQQNAQELRKLVISVVVSLKSAPSPLLPAQQRTIIQRNVEQQKNNAFVIGKALVTLCPILNTQLFSFITKLLFGKAWEQETVPQDCITHVTTQLTTCLERFLVSDTDGGPQSKDFGPKNRNHRLELGRELVLGMLQGLQLQQSQWWSYLILQRPVGLKYTAHAMRMLLQVAQCAHFWNKLLGGHRHTVANFCVKAFRKSYPFDPLIVQQLVRAYSLASASAEYLNQLNPDLLEFIFAVPLQKEDDYSSWLQSMTVDSLNIPRALLELLNDISKHASALPDEANLTTASSRDMSLTVGLQYILCVCVQQENVTVELFEAAQDLNRHVQRGDGSVTERLITVQFPAGKKLETKSGRGAGGRQKKQLTIAATGLFGEQQGKEGVAGLGRGESGAGVGGSGSPAGSPGGVGGQGAQVSGHRDVSGGSKGVVLRSQQLVQGREEQTTGLDQGATPATAVVVDLSGGAVDTGKSTPSPTEPPRAAGKGSKNIKYNSWLTEISSSDDEPAIVPSKKAQAKQQVGKAKPVSGRGGQANKNSKPSAHPGSCSADVVDLTHFPLPPPLHAKSGQGSALNNIIQSVTQKSANVATNQKIMPPFSQQARQQSSRQDAQGGGRDDASPSGTRAHVPRTGNKGAQLQRDPKSQLSNQNKLQSSNQQQIKSENIQRNDLQSLQQGFDAVSATFDEQMNAPLLTPHRPTPPTAALSPSDPKPKPEPQTVKNVIQSTVLSSQQNNPLTVRKNFPPRASPYGIKSQWKGKQGNQQKHKTKRIWTGPSFSPYQQPTAQSSKAPQPPNAHSNVFKGHAGPAQRSNSINSAGAASSQSHSGFSFDTPHQPSIDMDIAKQFELAERLQQIRNFTAYGSGGAQEAQASVDSKHWVGRGAQGDRGVSGGHANRLGQNQHAAASNSGDSCSLNRLPASMSFHQNQVAQSSWVGGKVGGATGAAAAAPWHPPRVMAVEPQAVDKANAPRQIQMLGSQHKQQSGRPGKRGHLKIANTSPLQDYGSKPYQRLPIIDEYKIYSQLLRWKLSEFLEPDPISRLRLFKTQKEYGTLNQYSKCQFSLILEETFASICSDVLNNKTSVVQCSPEVQHLQVQTYQRQSNLLSVRFVVKSVDEGSKKRDRSQMQQNQPSQAERVVVKNDDLLVLLPNSSSNHTISSWSQLDDLINLPHCIGIVDNSGIENNQSTNGFLCIRMPDPQENQSELRKSLLGHSKWLAVRLCSLVTNIRQLQTLKNLHSMPRDLVQCILQPSKQPQRTNTSQIVSDQSVQLVKNRLNESQFQAVQHAVNSSKYFVMITGPPGTGKTGTIAALVAALTAENYTEAHLGQLGLQKMPVWNSIRKPMKRVLVCAQSNAAIDEVVNRLVMIGGFASGKQRALTVVRVGKVDSAADTSMEYLLDNVARIATQSMADTYDNRLDSDYIIKLKKDLARQERDLHELDREQKRLIVKQNAAGPNIAQGTHGKKIKSEANDQNRFKNESGHEIEAKNVNSPNDMQKENGLGSIMVANEQFKLKQAMDIVKNKINQKTKVAETLSSKIKSAKLRLVQAPASRKAKDHIISLAEVVVATLSSAGGEVKSLLQSSKAKQFDYIIIDEAGQAEEPSTLIPLQLLQPKGTVCMVGDTKQLPPTILSRLACRQGFDVSLFDRFEANGFPSFMLALQYRMHPQISMFPSKTFYNGQLADGVSIAQRQAVYHKSPFFGPLVFWNVASGAMEKGRSGTQLSSSLRNMEEARMAMKICQALRRCYKPEDYGKIAIITPYRAQVQLIIQAIKTEFRVSQIEQLGFEVSTTDGFQGREADIIIFSCVRATNGPQIDVKTTLQSQEQARTLGFLADQRRLNVAITRARQSLWVIGHENTLNTSTVWRSLVQHIHKFGTVKKIHEVSSRIFQDEVARVQEQQRHEGGPRGTKRGLGDVRHSMDQQLKRAKAGESSPKDTPQHQQRQASLQQPQKSHSHSQKQHARLSADPQATTSRTAPQYHDNRGRVPAANPSQNRPGHQGQGQDEQRQQGMHGKPRSPSAGTKGCVGSKGQTGVAATGHGDPHLAGRLSRWEAFKQANGQAGSAGAQQGLGGNGRGGLVRQQSAGPSNAPIGQNTAALGLRKSSVDKQEINEYIKIMKEKQRMEREAQAPQAPRQGGASGLRQQKSGDITVDTASLERQLSRDIKDCEQRQFSPQTSPSQLQHNLHGQQQAGRRDVGRVQPRYGQQQQQLKRLSQKDFRKKLSKR